MLALRFKIIVLCALLFPLGACTFRSGSAKTPEHPIVAGCTIQEPNGTLLWSYPAEHCLFFPDGSFVTGGTDKGLELRGADQQVVWKKDLVPHHMISAAENGDILAVVSEWHEILEQKPPFKQFIFFQSETGPMQITEKFPKGFSRGKFRVDKLVRISRSGEVQGELSFFKNPLYTIHRLYHPKPGKDPKATFKGWEASHFNSVYEIPANKSPLPAFAKGNIITYDTLNRRLLILSPNLDRIVWRMFSENLGCSNAHDFQVLPSGNLLVFKNYACTIYSDSSLEEIDPVRRHTVWKYFDPDGNFRAPTQGSVQALSGDRIFFAYHTGKQSLAKMITRDGKPLWELDLTKHFDAKMQGAYTLPVESFLKHNQKL